MTTLIIRLFLLLVFAALSLFLSIDVLLWLGVPGIPGVLARIGSLMLIGAFALLLVTGGFGLVKAIFKTVGSYFSAHHRAQRRLWFIQNKYAQLKQLFYFKTVKLNYVTAQQRKRLLKANNNKHMQALSKTIHKDLLSIQQQIPRVAFKQLQQEFRQHCKRQDIQALLQLQEKIASIESSWQH